MNTKEFKIDTISQVSDRNAFSLTADRQKTVSRSVYVMSDGAIRRPAGLDRELNNLQNALNPVISRRHESTRPLTDKNTAAVKAPGIPARDAASSRKSLTRADNTPLSQITSTKAKVWLQKMDEDKLAVQWNVPQNIKRNCQDLLFGGADSDFVLRLYQNISVGTSGWKNSQRTLEYNINISRRKCYINLKNGGGKFTAEIGIRCSDGRYVFIARSKSCSTACFQPEEVNQRKHNRIKFTKTENSRPVVTPKTPRIFASRSNLDFSGITEKDLSARDIVSEACVNSVYQDFLREGPKVLRRQQRVTPSDFAARASLLQEEHERKKNAPAVKSTGKPRLNMQRLDSRAAREAAYQKNSISNAPQKSTGYVCEHLKSKDVETSGVMVASLLNTAGTIAIDIYKKEENTNPRGIERPTVKVKSKKALAEALKKSGIREKSELILSGKIQPGRKVRIGGLLIETEEDGSFCVACAIKNGKLHVPVEEVEAVIL